MQRFYSFPMARLHLFLPMPNRDLSPIYILAILGFACCLPSSFWRILHNTFLPFCLLQKIIILLILVKLYTINHSAYYPRQCAILRS